MEHERHQCFIYEGLPSQQLPRLAAMIQRRLNEGYRCSYLNSLPMVAAMRSSLEAAGIDVAEELAKGRLVLSSEPCVSANGDFDVDLMLHKLDDAVDQALKDGYKGLWATGDMTWEFGPQKNFAKLMEYEWKLEELFHKQPALCGICQYHRDTLPNEVTRQGLQTHQMIFINETLSRINQHYVSSWMPSDRTARNAELDKTINALCQLQS
jgi:hypothetical protein